jgi:hypothetical protein
LLLVVISGKGVPGLALSNFVPSCLATASTDGSVKLWDISNNSPSLVLTRKLKLVRSLMLTLSIVCH